MRSSTSSKLTVDQRRINCGQTSTNMSRSERTNIAGMPVNGSGVRQTEDQNFYRGPQNEPISQGNTGGNLIDDGFQEN